MTPPEVAPGSFPPSSPPSDAPVQLPADVRLRIDQHLDRVDNTLKSRNWTRSQRQAVTNDLETQIREMLAARTTSTPTVADVEAILSQLDPPESYGNESPPAVSPTRVTPPPTPMRRKTSRAAIAGLVLILLAVVPVTLIVAYSASYSQNPLEKKIQAERNAIEADRRKLAEVNARPREYDPGTAHIIQLRINDRELNIRSLQQTWFSQNGYGPASNPPTTLLPSLICPLAMMLPAIILGIVAIMQIRSSPNELGGMRLAIFDVAFPCVVFLALLLVTA